MAEARQKSYQRGIWAERVAAVYLRLKGYKILKHRYKTPVGEIDLIARKGSMLVFAEVKSHKDEVQALYAVNEKTRRRIEAVAGHFIATHDFAAAMDMRFDVIVVPTKLSGELSAELSGGRKSYLLGGYSIRHLDNAWLAGQ